MTTHLQTTDLPISVLVILAVASVGIYGFVLAGWSSNSPYSLLGALRSSAQMISYELSMGLALVAVFLYSRSMSTSEIVGVQGQPFVIDFAVFGNPVHLDLGLQNWFFLQLFPSFVIYLISMVGETNRAPFDLPECRVGTRLRLPDRVQRLPVRHLLPGRVHQHGHGVGRRRHPVPGWLPRSVADQRRHPRDGSGLVRVRSGSCSRCSC